MNLRKEYEALGIVIPDDRILTDSEDEFTYKSYNKSGQLVIVGYNRNTEVFWRNRDVGDEDGHV